MKAAFAALLLVISLPAHGAPVATGAATRVRHAFRAPARLLLVTNLAADAQLIGHGSAPGLGERYLIVDQKGELARGTVTVVSGQGPDGVPEHAVSLRLDRSVARPSEGWVVAVGPLAPGWASARVLAGTPSELADLPTRPSGYRLAIDLNGDGRADVAEAYGDCAPETQARFPGGGVDCVQVWAREGTTWRQVDEELEWPDPGC